VVCGGFEDLDFRSASAADRRDRDMRLRVERADVLDGPEELDLGDLGEAGGKPLGRTASGDEKAEVR
jgi:hypothetical protein